jgi:SAM-dependent methyltransferase
MTDWFTRHLCCPIDRSALTLLDERLVRVGDRVVEGFLRSEAGRLYLIEEGVPNLLASFRSEAERATTCAFGREWARYDDFEGFMGSPALFTAFTGLTREHVRGKTVLEVGCGGGRWVKVLAEMGARTVVGLDASSAVRQAARRTAAFPNVHIVRASALDMPLLPCFDLVVSVGVVHHLADPVLGLRNIRCVVNPAHLVAFWVYAREGNQLYLSMIGPLRRATVHLPDAALVAASRVLASALWLHVRTVNRMAVSSGIPLPLRDYLHMLARLRFRDIESVVYDQLAPQIARYPTRSEVIDWVRRAGGEIQRLYHRTGNSWQCHIQFPLANS